MTDIEIVATKLLGWEPTGVVYSGGAELYRRPDGAAVKVDEGIAIAGRVMDWPSADDYNSIRRVEDALAERNLLGPYLDKLEGIFMHEGTAYMDMSNSLRMGRLMRRPFGGLLEMGCALRATAAQRIAAAAKVLREVGS